MTADAWNGGDVRSTPSEHLMVVLIGVALGVVVAWLIGLTILVGSIAFGGLNDAQYAVMFLLYPICALAGAMVAEFST